MPQLIVALDSIEESANYIHIADVKENSNYYCPCCKGIIKPRAYKDNKSYLVQPHFYHEPGGCTEETYIHYICKNWLFDKGCRFIVDRVEYTVENIEVEKTLHTSFGDYIPDIIVTTIIGKIFYFEIKKTNKKNQLYAPKWDELGNDVVEIDTRYFINQKYKNDIPEFNLIYSDGECFIRNYSRTDYEDTIAKRKLEWKRQDKLNYKIQWERLDWFWVNLQKYIKGQSTEIEILEHFNQLSYDDKLWCYYSIKKKSCIPLKDLFKDNINQYFRDMIQSIENNNDQVTITLHHMSPKIYEIHCRVEFHFMDYTLFENNTVKLKAQKGDILPLECKEQIEKSVSILMDRFNQGNNILRRINHISTLPYVDYISPCSHYASEKYPLHSLLFTVKFVDSIHSPYVKENIGELCDCSLMMTENRIESVYHGLKKEALVKLNNEFMEFALKNNSKYQETIAEIKTACSSIEGLKLSVSKDNRRLVLFNNLTPVLEYEYKKTDLFGAFEEKIKESFLNHVAQEIVFVKSISTYVETVNSCKNKLWKASTAGSNSITLFLRNPSTDTDVYSINICINSTQNVKSEICKIMRHLLDYSENYLGLRYMEVK